MWGWALPWGGVQPEGWQPRPAWCPARSGHILCHRLGKVPGEYLWDSVPLTIFFFFQMHILGCLWGKSKSTSSQSEVSLECSSPEGRSYFPEVQAEIEAKENLWENASVSFSVVKLIYKIITNTQFLFLICCFVFDSAFVLWIITAWSPDPLLVHIKNRTKHLRRHLEDEYVWEDISFPSAKSLFLWMLLFLCFCFFFLIERWLNSSAVLNGSRSL